MERGGWSCQYVQEIGIKFGGREVRGSVRTSDLMVITELHRVVPQLARLRYQYHHVHGTGSEWNRPEEEGEIEAFLESVGIRLPGWLR